jgi:uncharacterized protein YbjT (DUF2867 family)
MYVITGASGNTGSVVAKTLLDQGKKVRVISRNSSHLRQFTERGAEAVVADITDTNQLARAFNGAEAVYAMIPPNYSAPDTLAYDERVTTSLASALENAKVRYVVNLSSIGAERPSGNGPVVGLYRQEQAFNAVRGLNVLHLRAGYFMENTLAQVDIIHATGSAGGPVRGDLKVGMIAAHDIGVAAAQALVRLDFNGHQSRELQGQRDISYNEVASIIGKAIGKPALKYTQLPDAQVHSAMTRMGMSPNLVDLLLQRTGAMNSGQMKAQEPRTQQNSTPTSYENFVAEVFLPVYQKASKAA